MKPHEEERKPRFKLPKGFIFTKHPLLSGRWVVMCECREFVWDKDYFRERFTRKMPIKHFIYKEAK